MRDTIPSVDSQVDRIKELFAAYAAGGVRAMAPFVDPEMELRPLTGEGKVYRGPAGLDEYLADLAAREEEVEAEPVGDFVEVGDCVVAPGRVRVRREAGSFADSQVTWVYRFEGGKLVQAVAYPGRLDPAEACRQLTAERD